VDFSADGKYLVTGDYRGRLTLWDAGDWLDEAAVPAHRGAILFLRSDPRGGLLASAGWDGAVKLWDLARLGERPAVPADMHRGQAWLATFSPDGATLASAGEDGGIRFRAVPADFRKRFLAPAPAEAAPAPAARTGPARLALLAPPGAEAARAVQALALAQLGGDKGVILLERDTVERLLREQKLSLAGLVSADTAVRAGKVLAADLLGVLEAVPGGKQAVGFTVFDAASGARLLDVTFTGTDPGLQARAAAAGARAAVKKWRAGPGGLKTVCFLPVRNADLPRGMDRFCEALAAALERQALEHPAVVTLERKRLDAVTKEKALAGGPAGALLASVFVVETEVGRAEDGVGLRATLTVRDAAGKVLHRVTHQIADPGGAGVLGPLSRGLYQALKADPGPALARRGREARRFRREADLLWQYHEYRQALQAAEAAYALSPDEDARFLLAHHLNLYALELLRPGIVAATRYTNEPFDAGPETVREVLGLARRAQQLIDAARARAGASGDPGGFWGRGETADSYSAEGRLYGQLRYVRLRPPDRQVEEELAAFRVGCVRRQVERVRELAGRVPRDPGGFGRLTSALINRYVTQVQAFAPDSATLAKAVRDLLAAWLEVTRDMPPDGMDAGQTAQFAHYVLSAACHTGFRELTYTEADRALLLPLLRALRKHPVAAVRLYAADWETYQLVKLGRINDEEAGRRAALAVEEARRLIERPPQRPRVALYLFLEHMLQAGRLQSGGRPAAEQWFALADSMLERGDVVAGPWCHAAAAGLASREYHARALNLIRRMREVYAAPWHRVFHDPSRLVPRELDRTEDTILKLSPGLARERPGVPWDRVLTLAESQRLPQANALLAPLRHGRHVYLLAGGTDRARTRPFLRLVRASLDGGPPELLGKAFVTLKDFDAGHPEYAFRGLPRFVTECVIQDGRLYAGTGSDGIYVFPLAGGDAERVGEEEGLPSPAVVSLAAADGKLVAALEDGYLVVYDPGRKRCEVIASSRRTRRASPFDDGRPFRARDLLADPERHRVLFVLVQETFTHPNTGTWEYNLKDRRFRKLLPLALYRPSRVEGGAFYLDGREWSGATWLGRFDLATDRFTLLQGKDPAGLVPQGPAGLPRDFSAVFPGKVYFGGHVWQAFPFARRPAAGGKEEYLPHPTQPSMLNASAAECLESVGTDRLLVGDWRGLYLVHLQEPRPAAAAAPPAAPARDPEGPPLRLRATGTGHANRVYRGVFTPDGKTFLSAGGDRVIRAWDVATGRERFSLKGHAAPLQGLGLAGDRLLVSAGEDGTIFLWDLALRKKVAELPRPRHPIHCLAVSRDGKRLATGGGVWNGRQPGELRLWDLPGRRQVAELKGPRRIVLGLAFTPDGKRLAAVDQSGDVTAWDLATRKTVTAHQEYAGIALQFSPDGKVLAAGGFAGEVRLYDPAGMTEEAVARGHRGAVLSLAYAPGGTILASAGHDGRVLLWNARALEDQSPLTLSAHQGAAWLVAFSPDGRTLATAGEAGRVKFWDVPAELAKRFPAPARVPPAAKVAGRTGVPRVALVAASPAAQALEDLSLARLSAAPGLRLLERAEVERLLREQKLSLAGLVEANTAVRAGKILAADLLAVLSSSAEKGEAQGVLVFDVATGLRLVDVGLTGPGLGPQAEQVVGAVRAAVGKWRAGPGGLKTVCFLPVRNADLPRGMDRFCEGLAAGLERDLLGAGAVAVLERGRLDLVNKEKGLAADAAARELLASLRLVQVGVSRAAGGEGVRATVTLQDSAGRPLARVTHEVRDPNGTGLLAPLAAKVLAALKAAPADGTASRNRESRRFLREAGLLWAHKYYRQGLRAAEAAFALRPGGEQRALLAEYLLRYATDLLDPGGMRTLRWGGGTKYNVPPDRLREALVHARRGLQLADAARAAPAGGGPPGPWPFLVQDAERFFFNKLPYVHVVPDDAEARQDYEDFRLFCLRRVVAHCYEAAEGADRDPAALRRYTLAIAAAPENLGRIAPSPAAYAQALRELARKWLDLSRGPGAADIPPATAEAFGGFLDRACTPPLIPRQARPDEAEAALEVLAAAVKHPSPIVRLYATHLQTRLLEKAGRLSRDEALARHRALLAEGRRLIDHPPAGPAREFRVALYRLLDRAIGTLYLHKQGADVIREYFDLCHFMLDRGDVIEEVVRDAVGYGTPVRELNLEALKIIDRALELTDSPKRRIFADSPDRFKFTMKQARHQVLIKLPDVLRASLPWESARPVATSAELRATLLLPGLAHDGRLYFFTGGEDPATRLPLLQLVRVPVEGGPVQVLGKAVVSEKDPPPPSRRFAFWINPRFVTSAAVVDGRLYAGTASEGILVFPLAGGAPARVGEKQGLPARHVQKLAAVGTTLVVALEGGYLVAYDTASGRCETLASSRRGEKRSPFDDAGPFTLAALAADPPRHRVLFTLVLPRANDPRAGLWELDVRTRKFRRVQPEVSGSWSLVTGGRIYIYQTDVLRRRPDVLLAYELAEDRFTLLHGEAPPGYGPLKRAGLPADLTVVFPGVGLLRRGSFWRAHPFGRRSLDGKQDEQFPSPRDNGWAYGFAASVSLLPAEPNGLLVGDYGALYLLRLKAPASSASSR
jgi:WD40 repeat protein